MSSLQALQKLIRRTDKCMVATIIVIRTQFTGLHKWEECPHEEVSFLRNLHRHIFHVEAKLPVGGDDRELEFFIVKREINLFLKDTFPINLGNMSCEMMAEKIGTFLIEKYKLPFIEVGVYEDNENGAVINCTSIMGGVS